MAAITRHLLPHRPRAASAPRLRGRRPHRWIGLLLVVVALLAPTAGVAMAARSADPAEQARQQREEIRRKKAALASQIDLVKASNEEVASVLTALDTDVRTQESKVANAAQAVQDAERRIATLQTQITENEGDVVRIQDELRKKAIQRYVNPEGAVDSAQLLKSTDFDQAEQRKALADTVTGNSNDVIDQLRGAKAKLADLQDQAASAKADAERLRQEQQSQLDTLTAARNEQLKVKVEWDKRLTGLRSQEGDLSAADAELTAVIQKAQAEAAAREAAARQAQLEAQRRAAQTPTPAPATGGNTNTNTPAPAPTSRGGTNVGGMIWPISGRVSQEFHSGHAGMDIFAPSGTPIWAAKAGTVIYAQFNSGGYGNLVVVDHGGGLTTAYAHLTAIQVSVGQSVGQGQQVGTEGSTGRSTGPHLHFETRVNGSAQNPRNFLPG